MRRKSSIWWSIWIQTGEERLPRLRPLRQFWCKHAENPVRAWCTDHTTGPGNLSTSYDVTVCASCGKVLEKRRL